MNRDDMQNQKAFTIGKANKLYTSDICPSFMGEKNLLTRQHKTMCMFFFHVHCRLSIAWIGKNVHFELWKSTNHNFPFCNKVKNNIFKRHPCIIITRPSKWRVLAPLGFHKNRNHYLTIGVCLCVCVYFLITIFPFVLKHEKPTNEAKLYGCTKFTAISVDSIQVYGAMETGIYFES
jgi:hypothetical protein